MELNQINEEKYRTILIHISCGLNLENRKYFTLKTEYEEKNKNYYLGVVREYYYHSLLYSQDFVIKSIKKFVDEPNQKNFINVAKSMREDLWGKKSNLTINDIVIPN